MSQTNRERYEKARRLIDERREELVNPANADMMLAFLDACDPQKFSIKPPVNGKGEQSKKTPNTLCGYAYTLRTVGRIVDLETADADAINEAFEQIYEGTPDHVKDGGVKAVTLETYQNQLRMFYRHHTGILDPAEIVVIDPEKVENHSRAVDESNMLTREEILAMRNAAGNLRNRALFDFLLYTGQRSHAARHIRIKDLDLENSRFKLNDEIDGNKGADEVSKWRDLLLSEGSVRAWLTTEHPDPKNPNAYLFTTLPGYSRVDPESPLGSRALIDVLRRMKDRALSECPSLADKPVNPHAMRHNFVTEASRRKMPKDDIKRQIGHADDSKVMETTYRHLSDEEYIKRAREAFGLETDEEEESRFTPEECSNCYSKVPSDAAFCHKCGLSFVPGAANKRQQVEEEVHADARDTEPDAEEGTALDQFRALVREHPELLDQLLGGDDDDEDGAAPPA